MPNYDPARYGSAPGQISKSATAALPKLISTRRLLEKTGCLKAALKHQEEPICRL